MSEHRPQQAERVGIISGPVTPEDESLVTTLLDRLGLQVIFHDREEYTQPIENFSTSTEFLLRRQPLALHDITHPDDWLVRENFDEHQRLIRRFSATTVSRAFNSLIDARDEDARQQGPGYNTWTGMYVYDQDARAYPLEGLNVAERTNVGLTPYNSVTKLTAQARSLAKFAIQAGSLQAAEDLVKAHIKGQNTQGYILSLIARLNKQIPHP